MSTHALRAALGLNLGCALLALASCRAANALEVNAEGAAELIRTNPDNLDLVLLDVRTPAEFAAGHLEGALNIDFRAAGFSDRIAALDRSRTYLVYCRTGNRSGRALPLFDRLGFEAVVHMSNGITAWQRHGLPVTQQAGRVP